MAYRLDLYWNDLWISDFDTMGDDPQFVYHEYSNGLLKCGLEKGISLARQKDGYIALCDDIYKKKRDCYKIKTTEHFMFLSAFFALHKLNYQPTFNNYIFLKKKKIILKNKTLHLTS